MAQLDFGDRLASGFVGVVVGAVIGFGLWYYIAYH